MVAGTPILSSDVLTHSAARFVSALWSDFALTLGMRRNSNSSLWIRGSLSTRNLLRSSGMVPLLPAALLPPPRVVLAPLPRTALLDLVIGSVSFGFRHH